MKTAFNSSDTADWGTPNFGPCNIGLMARRREYGSQPQPFEFRLCTVMNRANGSRDFRAARRAR